MRNKHLFPLGMALLLLAGHGARADRPLVSETADALPAGQCQVETGLARLSASGTPAATAIDAAAPCGVAGHSQLGIGVGAVRQASAANQKAAGRGRRHDSTRLAGVATKELTKALLGHLNLGWVRTESDRLNNTSWSLGIGGDGGLRWAADVYGDDRDRAWLSAGLLLQLTDKISANLAYAQQYEQPRVRQLTLGFKFAL